jgi:starvation-inducible DNA-binding protein
MSKAILDAEAILQHATPLVHQAANEIQPYGHLVRMPIAVAESACKESVDNLNQLLADTMTVRDMYKKHHWQVSGPTFYQLHLLFDKHADEQGKLVDAIAERIQLLGGVSIAMSHDVAETTLIPRPPKDVTGARSDFAFASRARNRARRGAGDGAARGRARRRWNQRFAGQRCCSDNELQGWFVAEHVVDTPVVRAD